jgi:serine protease Do
MVRDLHQSALPATEAIVARVIGTVLALEVPEGGGAGVLLSRSGLVATNQHLVEGWSSARLTLQDGRRGRALVLRSYRDVDLAFLQLESPLLEQALELARRPLIEAAVPAGRKPRLGERVLVIGHPMGLNYSLTEGVVSAVERRIEGRRYLQLDAAINPGNSGGPVLDRQGELLGLVSCSRSEAQGLHFAIPIDLVYARLGDLRRELQAGGRRYCAACGALSSDPAHCSHCGALLALADAVALLEETEAEAAAQARTIEGGTDTDSCVEAAGEAAGEAAAQPLCPACGSPLAAGGRYCPHCGSEP